jgi:hypothetical protein
MSALGWSVIALLIGSGSALAQGTQQTTGVARGGSYGAETIGRSGAPVPTAQAGASPFRNPLGQSLPPATVATNQFRNGRVIAPGSGTITPSNGR